MKNKLTIGLFASFLAVTIGLGINASAQSNDEKVPTKPQENPSKAKRPPLRFPGNSGSRLRLLNRDDFNGKLRKDIGATLKSFEAMTYKQYIDKYMPGMSGATDVADDRMIAVLEISFPKGIKTDNAEYSSATVRSVRDRETGELIEYEISGQKVSQPEDDRVVK
ncbi:MAG: hypothetical protein LH702_24310 [Phormidesmis sp. CAN_BIN44]|nr:hypothetical protein [Phormidesmis sp. CAN_BIN44]